VVQLVQSMQWSDGMKDPGIRVLCSSLSVHIDYVGLDTYREWKKIESPKEY
jgi:hypothetical protein